MALPGYAQAGGASGQTRPEHVDRDRPGSGHLHTPVAKPCALATTSRLPGHGCPFATVVTDWTSVSWAWLNPAVDLLFLPTDAGLERAQASGIPTDRVRVCGLPVSRRFQHVPADQKARHRSAMQLASDQPVVLQVCGSGGSGRCGDIARSVAEELATGRRGQLVVICGASSSVHQELLANDWPIPTTILGFVHDMESWMAASDLIICKAGPSTIAEALAVGLPLLIYDFIPGQEEGNVELAVAEGGAVHLTSPDEIATAVARVAAARQSDAGPDVREGEETKSSIGGDGYCQGIDDTAG